MKKVLGVFIFVSICTLSMSQTDIPKAQAMFIYNFSRLIEWPGNYKTGPFVIGVMGTSATLTELENYTLNKTVGTQSIIVKKFNTPAEIGICHILFVPFAKTKSLAEVVQALGGKSTLLIAEKNGAIDEGAAINFVIVGDKLKFEVKPSSADSKQIKMSSKLNEMAFKVY
ncbi:MAG: YfiR family protein [Bacteroidales bacterium]|nr:YfiR family protein [Bacteroidales bacterium]